ncbi:hypothetical protein GSI_14970 [Ganoderma sinense ZZ0214-1]|uniref:Uncharacterized protein n=1 Tax=Ganoderma sinense ZZ0214-1 TaxID=1077348 RepID=A0A2G8RQ74_9APHY|nr:hypothetical protein GSI_14970 [Ganoderma sinense ZZ0214-1]
MAPLRRQNSHFLFQYTVPLEPSGRPTRIVYRSLSAPFRVRRIRPSITAMYKDQPQLIDRRRQDMKRNKSPDRDLTPGPSSRRRDGTPAPATPSPSPSPPPSPILIPSTSTHHARARTPDVHMSKSASSAMRKGRGLDRAPHNAVPVTRSVSCSSVRHDAISVLRPGASQMHKRPAQPSTGVSLWTRFGIKNGSPTFVRRDRTSSSTDRDCVTAYYKSFSVEEICSPPDLSNDPQLEEGDIYINTVYDTGAPQVWIWTKDNGKIVFWKVAKEGDVREDGRWLSIMPKLGLPSWVKPEWCVWQMLKQQKGK